MKDQILRLSGSGICIICDPDEIYPNDPGQGQPVWVETVSQNRFTRTYSGSWDCAMDTGELDCGDYLLTEDQKRWLASQEATVEEWKHANHV